MAASNIQVTQGSGTRLGTNSYTEGGVTVHDEKTIAGEQYLPSYVANFSAGGAAVTTATAASHLMQVMAGASLRVRVRRIEVWQQAMATTATMAGIIIVRLTTAGTGGTAQGVNALDPADGAAGATAMSLPTVKGTLGALVHFSTAYMMQTVGASAQSTQPILAIDFDRPRSKPLIIAAGTTNGIAVHLVTAVAGATVWVNVFLDESSY